MPAHPRPHLLALALWLALPAHAADPPIQAQHDKQPTDLAAVEVRATPLADTAETLAIPVEILAGSTLDAAKAGVNAVHIIDGRVPHAMLLEILTEQAYGTMIRSH